ncbi:MAG: hypothetical protein FJ387_11625 [Verrucomicrobia bacterium]|nr:hypothetical protein [Verrucomicrobiota bacterium]
MTDEQRLGKDFFTVCLDLRLAGVLLRQTRPSQGFSGKSLFWDFERAPNRELAEYGLVRMTPGRIREGYGEKEPVSTYHHQSGATVIVREIHHPHNHDILLVVGAAVGPAQASVAAFALHKGLSLDEVPRDQWRLYL